MQICRGFLSVSQKWNSCVIYWCSTCCYQTAL